MSSSIETAIVSGFMHVLPRGVDHILFITSLALMTKRLRTRLALCSVFTLAHSCTLALSTLGFVHLSGSIVEPMIALSIVVVALMNIFISSSTELASTKFLRVLIIFAFGLFHGLGFASALTNLGLSNAELVPTLVGFNLGVELAQIVVILATTSLLALWRIRSGSASTIFRPLNSAVAAIALFWCVERAMVLWM